MDFEQTMAKVRDAKYPLLLLCLGVLLIIISGHGEKKASTEADDIHLQSGAESLEASEQRLSDLLREIDGVGTVHVLLSYESTLETEYVSDNGETVLLSVGSGKETALTKVARYPRFQGAVIVCQGAKQASVRLNVMEATARFTGLGTDRITVLQLRN